MKFETRKLVVLPSSSFTKSNIIGTTFCSQVVNSVSENLDTSEPFTANVDLDGSTNAAKLTIEQTMYCTAMALLLLSTAIKRSLSSRKQTP